MAISISKMSTTGGFLEKAAIEFLPGLNCIIGSRGTCKSTVVETIRFLFDADREKVGEMVCENTGNEPNAISHKGLLKVTLGGATARCEIKQTGADPESLIIERDVGTEPRIYKDGVKQIADRDVLQCIEIYSQGELQKIAEDSTRRLQLIDRPNQKKIDELKCKREALAVKLKETGNDIRTRRSGIEARRAEVKALDAYQQTLTDLEKARPTLSPELDEERTKYAQRQNVHSKASSLATKWSELVGNLTQITQSSEDYRAVAASLKQLGLPEATSLGDCFEAIAAFITRTKSEAADLSDKLPGQVNALGLLLDKLSEKYVALRKGQESLNEALRKEDQLRQQIGQLQRINDEANTFTAELNVLIEHRSLLRSEIAKVNDEIYCLRVVEVDRINQSYHKKVLLTLTQSSHAGGYRGTLARLLDRSRLRSQDEIADQIAVKIPPQELVDIVEAADSQRLAMVLERDLGQMARLVGYLVDNPSLYDVETQIFDDVLEITLFDEGTPKRVDQLSKGQKATAMLPLILREAEYPLIFDQPEDDLDNRFIYETLVQQIRELKLKRQLIFVTHNANIPVLGDAERVIVMHMQNPIQTGVPDVGNIDAVKDKILNLLEGGAEAFNLRQVKYGPLLNQKHGN